MQVQIDRWRKDQSICRWIFFSCITLLLLAIFIPLLTPELIGKMGISASAVKDIMYGVKALTFGTWIPLLIDFTLDRKIRAARAAENPQGCAPEQKKTA